MSACPHLRRPAPGPYFHPLFLIFQIPAPSRGGNQNLLPPSELCEQRVDEFDVDGEYDCREERNSLPTKKEQKKTKVEYQRPKKYKFTSVLKSITHIAEVFITNVALD